MIYAGPSAEAIGAAVADAIGGGGEGGTVDMTGVESRLDDLKATLGDAAGNSTEGENWKAQINDQYGEGVTGFDKNSPEVQGLQTDINAMTSDGSGTVGGLVGGLVDSSQGVMGDFANSQISLVNPECLLTVDLEEFGELQLDFCRHETFLDTMGSVFYSLAILSAFGIIFFNRKS